MKTIFCTLKKQIILAALIIQIGFIQIFAQHPNIIVGGKINSTEPEEPSIAINPRNTNEIVVGANGPNYYISSDTGRTWTHGILQSSLGVLCDPCIAVDTTGAFYYFHLTDIPTYWSDRVVCQKLDSIDGNWSDGTYTGLNGTKFQDKEWATVDPNNNYIYVTWTQFDQYGSTNPGHFSNIRFSRSTDGGDTWSTAKIINQYPGDCLDDDNTVEGAVPAVGPNGEIYVAWGGPLGIVFDKSLDYGETWLDNDIFVANLPGGWAFDIPGIYRCNGMPVTICDISGGPHHGNIYVNWSDQRNGTDDTDIWLSKSTDGGNTWCNPIRVNDDPPGKHQFFTWMAIDQTNGYVYIVFYDRRNQSNNLTDVYLAVSKDGGETFINYKISESLFNPTNSVFFGDYINIAAHNNVIRPIWVRLDNYDLSLWTAIINPDLLTEIKQSQQNNKSENFEIKSIHPNPFNATTTIKYELPKADNVMLKIYNMLGKEVRVLIDEFQTTGIKSIVWDGKDNFGLTVSSGVYYCRIESTNLSKSAKAILLK
jgi:hypothetical protein